MRKVRANDFRHHIQFYEQKDIPNGRGYDTEWIPVFKLWCREKVIFREQLESVISGGNTLRDRKELETRYTTKLNTEHRFKYKDKMYEISIVGDSVGDCKTIRFLGEAIVDGGA